MVTPNEKKDRAIKPAAIAIAIAIAFSDRAVKRTKLHNLILILRSAPPHTGSPGPFGPGTPEESEKSPERAPRGRAPKVPKECAPESRKSPKRV